MSRHGRRRDIALPVRRGFHLLHLVRTGGPGWKQKAGHEDRWRRLLRTPGRREIELDVQSLIEAPMGVEEGAAGGGDSPEPAMQV